MTNEDKNRIITLAEASAIYGFSHDYLRKLIQRNRLVAYKLGNFWTTTPTHVESYITSRKKRGVFRDDISSN